MKAWFTKNKKLLIAFGIATLITFLFTAFEINLILSNAKEIEVYAVTNEITEPLETIGLLGMINAAILIGWTFMFIFIILKVLFPDRRSVRNALFLDELDFLRGMPNEIRKGLKK